MRCLSDHLTGAWRGPDRQVRSRNIAGAL